MTVLNVGKFIREHTDMRVGKCFDAELDDYLKTVILLKITESEIEATAAGERTLLGRHVLWRESDYPGGLHYLNDCVDAILGENNDEEETK